MLVDFTVPVKYQKQLSGVMQSNNSSRVQVLSKRADNGFMFDLLKHLYEQYDILALINTSFNQKGSPIVNSQRQAFKAANKMGLDGIVINGKFKILE